MASKISHHTPLWLASGSPRRKELLSRMGIPLRVEPVDVDEAVSSGEGPDVYLKRIVKDKLAAALRVADGSVVLVADTIVAIDDAILGKPTDDEESAAMIRRLAGRSHIVSTRYVVAATDVHAADTVSTTVWFRALPPEQIARYVATGEGRDKAGAYGIQGVGAMLVERIDGDYSNVVGLPICAVVMTLQRHGLIGVCPAV